MDANNIIADIELAIIERLRANGLDVAEFSIYEEPESVQCPAVNVAFISGTGSRITNTTVKISPATFKVTLLTQNLLSEAMRRSEALNLTLGAAKLLFGKKLSITDGATVRELPMKDMQISNIQKAYGSPSRFAYSMDVSTAFNIVCEDDEEAVNLLRIGMGYNLKPGDDTADANDLIDLEQ